MSQLCVLVVLLTSILLLPSAAASVAECAVQSIDDWIRSTRTFSDLNVCDEFPKHNEPHQDVQHSPETAAKSMESTSRVICHKIQGRNCSSERDKCTQAKFSWLDEPLATKLKTCKSADHQGSGLDHNEERRCCSCDKNEYEGEVMTDETSSTNSFLNFLDKKQFPAICIPNVLDVTKEQCVAMPADTTVYMDTKSHSHDRGENLIVHGFTFKDKTTRNVHHRKYVPSEDRIVSNESYHERNADDELLKQALLEAIG